MVINSIKQTERTMCVLSVLEAQLVKALPSDLGHAEHPRFKPHSDLQLIISTVSLELYQFDLVCCAYELPAQAIDPFHYTLSLGM